MATRNGVVVVGAFPQELAKVEGAYITGVGKVSAAIAMTRILHFYQNQHGHPPSMVLNLGSCGALTSDFEIGEVVQCVSVTEHDAMSVEVVSRLVSVPCHQSLALGPFPAIPSDAARSVRCATGDSFVSGNAERHALLEVHEAQVCDMELFALARACMIAQVPILSLKVVSDVPGHTVADWLEHLDGIAEFIGGIPWREWLS